MFRQSPRRNGRNKGLKIKHVLQISLLFGVGVWLFYQVHHSDDKKPSLPSDTTKKLHNIVSKDMLRLGRKHLQPKLKQPGVVHDKKESEEHQGDEGGSETEPEDLVHDHESEEHEDMKHEEDREHEEETTETEREHLKINKAEVHNEGKLSDGGEEIKGRVNENVSDEQNKVIVVENKENEDAMKKMMNSNTSGVGPSVDISIQRVPKDETIQQMDSVNNNTSQDSNMMPSVDLKSALLMNKNLENSMNSNGEVENQKEQESNENENENNEDSEVKSEEGGVLEEEKEALTDLGTLPESGIGGSRSTENTAAE